MKKAWLIGLVLLVGLAATGFTFGHMWGPSMLYSGGIGSRQMGRGMMGPVMMMGSRWCPMMGYGYRGNYSTYSLEPLTKEEATTIARNYVLYSGMPNLKVGEIKELEHEFEIEIVTKSNSLVGKILIDKQTGQIRPIY